QEGHQLRAIPLLDGLGRNLDATQGGGLSQFVVLDLGLGEKSQDKGLGQGGGGDFASAPNHATAGGDLLGPGVQEPLLTPARRTRRTLQPERDRYLGVPDEGGE